MEQTHGIRTSTHTGQQHIREPPKGFQALLSGFVANHGMEITHQHGVGMGARHRSKDVVGGFHIGHPIADGFARCVFQGGRPCRYRLNGGSQ